MNREEALGQGWYNPFDYEDEELADALNQLAQTVDLMYSWGQNAKDPMGNVMAREYAESAKLAYRKIRKGIDCLRERARRGK